MSLLQQIMEFLREEGGAELAEYAVGIALLVAVALVVYTTLGKAINDENQGTGAQIKAASGKAFPF